MHRARVVVGRHQGQHGASRASCLVPRDGSEMGGRGRDEFRAVGVVDVLKQIATISFSYGTSLQFWPEVFGFDS